jgi:hypothetical protein
MADGAGGGDDCPVGGELLTRQMPFDAERWLPRTLTTSFHIDELVLCR